MPNIHLTISLFFQEIIKKLKDLTDKDLFFLLESLIFAREGNIHYYELLGIAFVKNVSKYQEHELTSVIYSFAQANLSSETCAKAISAELKPKILAQASAIPGSAKLEHVSVKGLIGNSSIQEFELDEIKSSLFPEFNEKSATKTLKIDVDDLYSETKHPFIKFDEFLNLSWGYLKLALDSKIAVLDATSWSLCIKLLNKHLSNLNVKDKSISNLQYDQNVQIKHFSELKFPTMEKLVIPRPLKDYTLHHNHHYKVILTE